MLDLDLAYCCVNLIKSQNRIFEFKYLQDIFRRCSREYMGKVSIKLWLWRHQQTAEPKLRLIDNLEITSRNSWSILQSSKKTTTAQARSSTILIVK